MIQRGTHYKCVNLKSAQLRLVGKTKQCVQSFYMWTGKCWTFCTLTCNWELILRHPGSYPIHFIPVMWNEWGNYFGPTEVTVYYINLLINQYLSIFVYVSVLCLLRQSFSLSASDRECGCRGGLRMVVWMSCCKLFCYQRYLESNCSMHHSVCRALTPKL